MFFHAVVHQQSRILSQFQVRTAQRGIVVVAVCLSWLSWGTLGLVGEWCKISIQVRSSQAQWHKQRHKQLHCHWLIVIVSVFGLLLTDSHRHRFRTMILWLKSVYRSHTLPTPCHGTAALPLHTVTVTLSPSDWLRWVWQCTATGDWTWHWCLSRGLRDKLSAVITRCRPQSHTHGNQLMDEHISFRSSHQKYRLRQQINIS